ncbi:homeobox-like protein HDP1 [Hydra vulgaris]|uniref:Homeobox-like protein HDP1 n=1 Tax=Hydra vulgaris TaxID=6087 RepID=A0ABM4DLS3_HYDVU
MFRTALIDSGCSITVVHAESTRGLVSKSEKCITTLGGTVQVLSEMVIKLEIDGIYRMVNSLIVKEKPFGFDLIFGMDAIEKFGGAVIYGDKSRTVRMLACDTEKCGANCISKENEINEKNEINEENEINEANEENEENEVNEENEENEVNEENEINDEKEINTAKCGANYIRSKENEINEKNEINEENEVNEKNEVNEENKINEDNEINEEKEINKNNKIKH